MAAAYELASGGGKSEESREIWTRRFCVDVARTAGPNDVLAVDGIPGIGSKYSPIAPTVRCVEVIATPDDITDGLWLVTCEYQETKTQRDGADG